MNPADAFGMTDSGDTVAIPVSAGIPPIVRIATLLGILLVFVIVGLVIWQSMYGHVWPSENSTKVPLPAAPAITSSK